MTCAARCFSGAPLPQGTATTHWGRARAPAPRPGATQGSGGGTRHSGKDPIAFCSLCWKHQEARPALSAATSSHLRPLYLYKPTSQAWAQPLRGEDGTDQPGAPHSPPHFLFSWALPSGGQAESVGSPKAGERVTLIPRGHRHCHSTTATPQEYTPQEAGRCVQVGTGQVLAPECRSRGDRCTPCTLTAS